MADWVHIRSYRIAHTNEYRRPATYLAIRLKSKEEDLRIRLNGLDIDTQNLLQHMASFSAHHGVTHKGIPEH